VEVAMLIAFSVVLVAMAISLQPVWSAHTP
jgi:hypothetical protein